MSFDLLRALTRRLAIASVRFNDDRNLVLKTMMKKRRLLEAMWPPLEERARRLAVEREDVKLLVSFQGVDFHSASLSSPLVGAAERFHDDDQLNSFFGVIPFSRDSGGKQKRGKRAQKDPREVTVRNQWSNFQEGRRTYEMVLEAIRTKEPKLNKPADNG